MCDGSVDMINYSIDLETHRCPGNRHDGQTIDGKMFWPVETGLTTAPRAPLLIANLTSHWKTREPKRMLHCFPRNV